VIDNDRQFTWIVLLQHRLYGLHQQPHTLEVEARDNGTDRPVNGDRRDRFARRRTRCATHTAVGRNTINLRGQLIA
jgi:hypothetical protein